MRYTRRHASPPEAVWPWLVQVRAGRASYSSFDWLERLGGLDIRNSDTLQPECQAIQAGDKMLCPDEGFEVVALEPPRRMVLVVRGRGFAVSVSFQLDAVGREPDRTAGSAAGAKFAGRPVSTVLAVA